ncbi:hypothetical protein ETB97_012698 [Aspergillus alliaceus]|uniref:Uncharacterized protein n=1 Tax=Petromyces alliaceus TaxID=209559 RepID=A0A8H6E7R8_PETAA|nr:hypothetical protein ETB97_012698 [Aspergillus burnettii]
MEVIDRQMAEEVLFDIAPMLEVEEDRVMDDAEDERTPRDAIVPPRSKVLKQQGLQRSPGNPSLGVKAAKVKPKQVREVVHPAPYQFRDLGAVGGNDPNQR